MKYYLIAGEASGDLHASRLMASVKAQDAAAEFRGIGGDLMAAEGMAMVQHYRDLAYMGILPVLRHLPTILRGMERCKRDIVGWKPDAVILVDYPGFNLKMARFVKKHTSVPVFYYIAPKIWAWKEYRIGSIKRDVDTVLSILPFERKFYEEKHHYPIHYVGNPTVDEVEAFLSKPQEPMPSFLSGGEAASRPVIALLPGSRKQEVRDNLRRMVEAAMPFAKDYQLVVAAAPGLDDDFYETSLRRIMFNDKRPPLTPKTPSNSPFRGRTSGEESLPIKGEVWRGSVQRSMISVVRDQTYNLLRHSTAALVTSGTATLETALMGVPQVVCYYTKAGRLVSLLRKLVLNVPYVSLVNLIAGEEVVPELIAHEMNVGNVRRHLADILPGGNRREAQLQGYSRMAAILGQSGASDRAAKIITDFTKK